MSDTTMPYAARLEAAIERAAICEYDAGMPRALAEDLAAIAWRVRIADVRGSAKGEA